MQGKVKTGSKAFTLSVIWQRKHKRLPKRQLLREHLAISLHLQQSFYKQTSHRIPAGIQAGPLGPSSESLWVDPAFWMHCHCNHKRFPALHFIGFPFTHRKWHLLLLSCFWAILISSTALWITSFNTVLFFKSQLFSCQQKNFKPQEILRMEYKYTLGKTYQEAKANLQLKKTWKKKLLHSYCTFNFIIL